MATASICGARSFKVLAGGTLAIFGKRLSTQIRIGFECGQVFQTSPGQY
jgi:hypothetical protein